MTQGSILDVRDGGVVLVWQWVGVVGKEGGYCWGSSINDESPKAAKGAGSGEGV
jgi:hypothetical protein